MKKFLLLGIFSILLAQWSEEINGSITVGEGILPQAAAIADGGTWLAWLSDGDFHVYVQFLNGDGVPQLGDGGLLISAFPNSSWIAVFHMNLVADPDGNAVLSYMDTRTGSWQVYVQKVSQSGELLWGANGLAVSTGASCMAPRLCALGNFVVVAWSNDSGSAQVQRINSDGSFAWDNGVALNLAGYNLSVPEPLLLASGNIGIQSVAQTPGWPPTSQLTQFELSPDGEILSELALSDATSFPMGNWAQDFKASPLGGTASSWTEMASPAQAAFVQGTAPEGGTLWNEPQLLSGEDAFRTNPQLSIGESGRILSAFTSTNLAQSMHGLNVQMFEPGGEALWGSYGQPIVTMNDSDTFFDLTAFNCGLNMIAMFIQNSGATEAVRAFRIDCDGELVWGGIVDLASSGSGKSDMFAARGDAWTVATWVENGEIHAHCLRYDGTLGAPIPVAPCEHNGDVNADGSLNVLDIVQIVNFIVGLSEPTPEQFCAGDINEDDVVNILDVVVIVQQIVNEAR